MFRVKKGRSVFFLFEVLLVAVILEGINHGECHMVDDNPWRRGEFLDAERKYELEWIVDPHLERITFNVTVQTRGWILFGMANDDGERTTQDVVLGGVKPNGEAYFSDLHSGQFYEQLQAHKSEDYTLETFWESDGYTGLSFSRDLDTCDHQNYPIDHSRITLIWAYGEQDDEHGSFHTDRGTYNIHLLDPEFTPQINRENPYGAPSISGPGASSIQAWTVSRTILMPEKDTTYLCTIHKTPHLGRKHHVIGFDVYFPDDQSKNHIHHVIVFRCVAPSGSTTRDLFDPYSKNGELQSCFQPASPGVGPIAAHFCTRTYYEWSAGGRAFFMPDHVGFPFGEEEDEYYMFQIHYNNPLERSDLQITVNVDFFYTSHLRPNEGGLMAIASDVPGLPETMLVPPRTRSMRSFGHCSADCTKRMFPYDGITIAAARLHGHISTRRMKVRHFRGNTELPWILSDDNYSNYFQQFRGLRQGDVRVLPGDQITIDCTHTTWTNGTVVSGFRTQQEMCAGWFVYYNVIEDYSLCLSGPVSPAYRERFLGVTNITYLESRLDWVAQPPSPQYLVGRTMTDISDSIEWDQEARNELQEFHLKHPHVAICHRNFYARDPNEIQTILDGSSSKSGELIIKQDLPPILNPDNDFYGSVSYPFSAKPYSPPPSACSYNRPFHP